MLALPDTVLIVLETFKKEHQVGAFNYAESAVVGTMAVKGCGGKSKLLHGEAVFCLTITRIKVTESLQIAMVIPPPVAVLNTNYVVQPSCVILKIGGLVQRMTHIFRKAVSFVDGEEAVLLSS